MGHKSNRYEVKNNLSKVWGRNQSLGQFVWSELVWTGKEVKVVNLEYKGNG